MKARNLAIANRSCSASHIKKRAYDTEDWRQWRPVDLPEKAQHSRERERDR